MTFWVYILASRKHGTLYVGVTNSLERRIAEHRAKEAPGFTKKHGVDRLIFYCGFGEATAAIGFREAPEALAARLEDPPDRRRQPALGRSLPSEYRARLGYAVFMGPGHPLRGFRDDTEVGRADAVMNC